MNRAFVYMMVGASLWGTISIFVKNLYAYEFTPMEVVTIRAITASIVLVSYLLISSPKSLKLKQIKDLKYFVRTGIFSKFALTKYTTLTVTTYTFVIASIVLLPFFPIKGKTAILLETEVLFYGFSLGFLPTAMAYIIYTYGFHNTEASKAAILSTIEPVVATLIGIFVFLEPFSFIQIIGMAFILGAVILTQLDQGERFIKKKVHSN